MVAPVHGAHIGEVIEDPERFGWSRAGVEAVFARHGEPLGHEGHARQEILADLVGRRRWIRILRHRDRWSIEFASASPRTLAHFRG